MAAEPPSVNVCTSPIMFVFFLLTSLPIFQPDQPKPSQPASATASSIYGSRPDFKNTDFSASPFRDHVKLRNASKATSDQANTGAKRYNPVEAVSLVTRIYKSLNANELAALHRPQTLNLPT